MCSQRASIRIAEEVESEASGGSVLDRLRAMLRMLTPKPTSVHPAPAAASKRRDRRNAILFIEDDDDAHTVYFEKPIDDDIRQTGGICQ